MDRFIDRPCRCDILGFIVLPPVKSDSRENIVKVVGKIYDVGIGAWVVGFGQRVPGLIILLGSHCRGDTLIGLRRVILLDTVF